MRRAGTRITVSATMGFALSMQLTLVVSGAASALAQESTPGTTFPISPDASECTVDARPLADFERLLLATPQADPAASDRATPFVIPEGEPADETTIAGVTATLLEMYACYQAGDPRRFHTLFTDEGIQRSYPSGLVDREFIDEFFAASPEPVEETDQRATILAIEDVTLLADGRVGALVRSDEPEFGGLQTVYWIFKETGGRFLVDDVIHGLPTSS